MIILSLLATMLFGGGLIGLLISLLVFALIIYVVFLILGMLPLPEPAKTIIVIILSVIFLLVLLGRLGLLI